MFLIRTFTFYPIGGSTSKGGMGTGRESKTKKVKKGRARDVDEDVSSETLGRS